jgi:hypothetical protein
MKFPPEPSSSQNNTGQCVSIRMAENLVRFIRLNESRLGRKRRETEFEKLTDDEVASIEAIVREAFEGFES